MNTEGILFWAARIATAGALALWLTGCGGAVGGSSSPAPAPPTALIPSPSPAPGSTSSPTPNPTPPPGDPMVSSLLVAANWDIGPVIDGRNYSVGVPRQPTQTPDGWAFDFPLAGGNVNYITYKYGSLIGKSRIVMRYRIEADPDVKFLPKCCADLLGQGPTMYIQRDNDNWRDEGGRWWATFDSPWPITAGEFELNIPLNGNWTSVYTWTAQDHPADFADAKARAGSIGFTFGGGDGYGHGVYATGRARFVLLSFKVE